ncbi:hypothetical protein [Bradyrhizobium sp. USDA 4486]
MFAQAAKDYWWIGLIAIALSITVTILTTLATFLKPEEKQSAHFNVAIAYDKLNGEARMLREKPPTEWTSEKTPLPCTAATSIAPARPPSEQHAEVVRGVSGRQLHAP